jgi:hypothetical protein
MKKFIQFSGDESLAWMIQEHSAAIAETTCETSDSRNSMVSRYDPALCLWGRSGEKDVDWR